LLKRYEKVLIPELNLGQLRMLIRGTYMVDAIGLNKVQGKPFHVVEVVKKIQELLAEPSEEVSRSPALRGGEVRS
jgi:2-oxoglutarate ferredoxin oxidoreductase subunit alpha